MLCAKPLARNSSNRASECAEISKHRRHPFLFPKDCRNPAIVCGILYIQPCCLADYTPEVSDNLLFFTEMWT